jgi:HEAT repeat protein
MRSDIDWRARLDACSLGLALLCFVVAGCQRGPRTLKPTNAAGKATVAKPEKKAVSPARPTAVVQVRTIPAFRTWGVRETATDALARIGDAAVPALIDALHDPDQEVRAQAAQALARMGNRAAPAVDALVEALNDPNEDVRRGAARALGQIGSEAEQAVPALINAIRDPRNKRHPQPVEVEVIPAKTGEDVGGRPS